MNTYDHTKQSAKAARHEETNPPQKKGYEHPEITDNRLVWEVLDDNDT